ncbi:hypothetical protein [Elioraea sp.]|uniref:hypothetical protein n=1 Tax=Elioraea sp. TaxID=2185103 RepID=UPI003F72BA62
MTDLTVRLVLTADGRPLRTEIVGATRQVEQFTTQLERGGVRVERSSVQAEGAMRRVGAAATGAGTQIATAMDGRATPSVTRLQTALFRASTAASTVLTTVGGMPGQFGAVANAGGRMAAALSGGLAGVAVQLAAFGAQMLFAQRSTETAEQASRTFGDAQIVLQRALSGVSDTLETAEQRTRRLTIAQRQNALAQLENARVLLERQRAEARAFVQGTEAEIARLRSQLGEQDFDFQTFRDGAAPQLRERANLLRVLEAQLDSLAAAERRLFNAPLPSGRPEARAGGAARPAARAELDPFARLREAGRALEQELRTPLERYRDELQRLDNLFQGGFINTETWTRGLARAGEELQKAQRSAEGASAGVSGLEGAFERLEESIEGVGRASAQMLADALVGVRALEGGVMGLIQRFASDVLRKLIYDQITAPLAQAAGVLLRSGLGSLFGAFSGASAHSIPGPPIIPVTATPLHTGGIVGREGGASRAVPEALFAHAPRLHSGGFIGPGEVPIIAKRGEGVFTPEQMAAMGSGTVIVQNIDQRGAGAPPIQTETGRGPRGELVIRQIIRNEVSRGIADGAFDREMGMAYGARRAGLR